jgi:outer membrane murein-binding lipoprotein Lpp
MVKKLLVITVLVIVASLSVCGCTTTTNNNTATSPPTTHDALLEKLVNATKEEVYGNESYAVQAWDVTWNNGTSVTIIGTAEETSTGITVAANSTLMSFPTTQDATNYLNAFNKTNYSLTSTDYASDTNHIYYNATGHTPSVYKEYTYTEGSILDGSMKVHELIQYDNIIQMGTATATL